MRVAVALLLAGCASLQVPGQPCGAVQVAPGVAATANHCADKRVLWRVEGADLAFVFMASTPKPMRILPVESGTVATLRGREFTVMDPLRLSDGHLFLLVTPEFEHGDSGFELWYEGEVIGVAIGNDGARGVAVASGEIARQLVAKAAE